MDLKQIEKITKALGDLNRLKILQYMQDNGGQLACNEINCFLNLAQPSISHHIKKMVEADLIEAEKEGRFHSYSLNKKVFNAYIEKLKKL